VEETTEQMLRELDEAQERRMDRLAGEIADETVQGTPQDR
jgi:hypothetical protein